MKVKVENFQSIKEAEIEIKGLTVITGENSIGKSAMARALSGVFTNTRGDSHVRNGEKYSSVFVDFGDGNKVLWEKGKGVNRYEVNGQLIPKAGSGVPQEVQDLGVKSIEVDGKDLSPQIAKQFETIFLLDLPPSVLSSALSDVERIQALEQASSMARSDIRNMTSRLKIKREDLDVSRVKATAFEGYDPSYIENLDNKEHLKNEAEKSLTQVENLALKREKLSNAQEIITPINGVHLPHLSLDEKYNIPQLEKDYKRRVKGKLMEGILGVGLSEVEIPDVPQITDTDELERLSIRREKLKRAIHALSYIQQVASLPTPDLNEEALLLLEKKGKLEQGVGLIEQEVSRLNIEIEETQTEILKGVCPTCLRGGHGSC